MQPLRIVVILLVLGVAGTACTLYWDTHSGPGNPPGYDGGPDPLPYPDAHVGDGHPHYPDANPWYPDAPWNYDGGPYYPDAGSYGPDGATNCGGACPDAGSYLPDACASQ
jgi:hypothetical protein